MSANLKKVLQNRLQEEELAQLVGSFDVVGDIAVVLVPNSLLHRSELIAEAVLATNRRLKVVARRSGGHEGEFRTQPLAVIGGENRTETEVREFGLRYRLNLASCYFSVRSGSERRRVAGLVREGERVLVLFSGIAPFPLVLARYSPAALVAGVEKNPAAHGFAVENVRLNRLEEKVRLYCADVGDVASRLREGAQFHRLLMPLPKGADAFLSSALPLLLPGGTLHFYKMAGSQEVPQVVEKIRRISRGVGRYLANIHVVKAGHCGNRVFRYSFDVKII